MELLLRNAPRILMVSPDAEDEMWSEIAENEVCSHSQKLNFSMLTDIFIFRINIQQWNGRIIFILLFALSMNQN